MKPECRGRIPRRAEAYHILKQIYCVREIALLYVERRLFSTIVLVLLFVVCIGF